MIIGNGLLAHSLTSIDQENVVFFASGVSNSAENESAAFLKEKSLLLAQNPQKLLVYFGTTSVNDPSKTESPYIRHKLQMEEVLMNHFKHFLICRLPNMVGPEGNPHTLVPYFIQALKNRKKVEILNHAVRRLMNTADLPKVLKIMLKHRATGIYHVAPESEFSVLEIYLFLAKSLQVEPHYRLINGGAKYFINTAPFKELMAKESFILNHTLEQIILPYIKHF